MSEKAELSYFQKRCAAIGLTADNNKLVVPEYAALKDSKILEYPLLCEDEKTGDIIIPLYDIKGEPCNFYKDNSGKLYNGKTKPLEIRRYAPGNERIIFDKGKEKKIKYETPKGAKALPWISPNIIEAYRNKQNIDTIVITEGQIKALCGYLKGLYIFGINGHSNIKDRDSGQLHADILETIITLNVKNVLLLYDGDCVMLRAEDVEKGTDLRIRPHGFFSSARNSRELLKDYWKHHEFDVYFAHINSTELEGMPKGLDDLFEAFESEESKIIKELNSFSKTHNHYFYKTNITAGLSRVLNHLHLNTAEQFYTGYNQVIKENNFVFNGTKYQWDAEKNELKLIVPAAAKSYFRVGDHYYEKLFVPNKNGILEYQYHRRLNGTIISDHGKEFIKHIPKYKAFCAKPDHVNYQEVIDNCFNRYKPFEHESSTETSDCPETMFFLKHIFAEQIEYGLDYIQLLYQQPTQMLPILCLVSKENKTGKSTMVDFLKTIFTGNMAIIGNDDLESDFNAGWADKLIVGCNESFLDKKKTIEKIKALSTGNKIVLNQKGVDHVEIDCFLKFIFCSNNEDNFIIASEHDTRYWVRRIPTFETERTDLLQLMVDEIPAFLSFLNKRTLFTKKESRMWFREDLLKTDALKKLIEGNKSTAEREIFSFMRSMMLEQGFYTLEYKLSYVVKEILRGRYESSYVERILKEKIKVETCKTSKRFKYPVIVKVSDGKAYHEEIVLNSDNGKPYTFRADMFLTKEEISTLTLCSEAKAVGQEINQTTLPIETDIIIDGEKPLF
jgi:hypothetical protein